MSAEEYIIEGNKAFMADSFEVSVNFFTKAIDASSTPDSRAYLGRSNAYAKMKQYARSLVDAQKSVEIDPSQYVGYVRVGAAQLGVGELEEARAAYAKALELEPGNEQAKKGLETVAIEILRNEPVGKLFTDPSLVAKLQKIPDTAELIQDPDVLSKVYKLISSFSDNIDLLSDPIIVRLTTCLLKAQEKSHSISTEGPSEDTHFRVAVEKDPIKGAEQLKAEANKLYKNKQFDEAIVLYNKAWELHKDVRYLNNRAAAEYEKGDYGATIETCQEAVSQARTLRSGYQVIAKSLARIGTTYLKQKKYEDAVTYFERALTEHRTADILAKLRSAQKLIREREANLYVDPEKAELARLEGKEYFIKGDWPNAVKAYTEMIKRAPEDARGYNNRATVLSKLMSFPEALRDAETAIKKDPTFIKAYIRKAHAEVASKNYRAAIDTLGVAEAKDRELYNGANLKEISQLSQKAFDQRFQVANGETLEQATERFMKDPEVIEIMQDPVMNNILQQARANPLALQDHMKNPSVAKKIQVLVAAGIIRTR